MQEEKQNTTVKGSEISLKEVILKILDWWRFLLSKWLIILIFGLTGGALGLVLAISSDPKYQGELTFVLEDSKSNPLSAYMGLASQFGLDLGSSSGSGVFEGDNILEFLKSRLMIEATLLSPVEVDGKQKSLADVYIAAYELDKKWQDNERLKGLHFPLGLHRAKFSLQQDSVLNEIQKSILKENLQVSKPDKKLNFISVKCSSLSELFSKAFTERLVNKAIEFYVNTRLKHSKANVDRLQVVADSLETLLNRKTYALAVTRDVNQNPARQVAGVKAEVESRDKLVLQTMYGEVIKNLELSKVTMEQETPIVQIVDTPILPLEKKKLGKAMGIIIGGFLGGILIVSFLVGRRILKEAIEEA
jgi:hypothetical protein